MGETKAGNGEGAQPGLLGTFADLYQWQSAMLRVVVSLVPIVVASVYLFGWRSLSIIVLCVGLGSFTEWLFCRARGEKISSAVFVTAFLLALTLPPTVPYMVAAVAVVVAIVFGKEVFGGFGRNVYNPALVGRCFVYICFPVAMTSQWLPPFSGFPAGFARWAGAADAVTRATPLVNIKAGEAAASLQNLLLGNVAGSLGETSAVLIILAGIYLVATKTANWRIIVSCLAGGVVFSILFSWILGTASIPGPAVTLSAGAFLFGAVFMATDPISAPDTNLSRYVYGVGIGGLTVIIRGLSNFPGGVMFAIILMNTFAPIMDHYARKWKKARREARKKTEKAQEEENGE